MEDYKEKYEKVLKKVQELFKKGEENKYLTINAWRTEFEEIFPELRESEDEKIRTEIICFLRNIPNSNYTCEEMAAWLEKQGEKPADKVEPKFHKGDWIITNKNHIWYVDETPETTSYLYRLVNQYGKVEVAEFEIVDKKARLWTIQDAKDGDVLSYRDGQWCFIYKGIVTEDTFKYYALLSEKGITVNDAAFCLLTSCFTPATKEQRDILMEAMADAGYVFEKKKLKKIEQKPTVNKVKLEFKKGDILYEQKTMTILLVHGRSGNWLQVFCHYWMLKEKFTAKPPYENYGIVQEMSLVPASEEQKKLLLKKIKEEGYEWDADKLELKYLGKNKQKPVLRDTFGYEEGRQFGKNEVLGNPEKYGLQKPAELNDDDKQYLLVCKNALYKYQVSDQWDANIIYQWLENKVKSSVQRPRKEWSEEDEDAIAEAIIALEYMYDPDEPERCYAGYTLTFDKAAERLKSLRPQNRWKPSEEQMKALKEATDKQWDVDGDALWYLYQDLKKLIE